MQEDNDSFGIISNSLRDHHQMYLLKLHRISM